MKKNKKHPKFKASPLDFLDESLPMWRREGFDSYDEYVRFGCWADEPEPEFLPTESDVHAVDRYRSEPANEPGVKNRRIKSLARIARDFVSTVKLAVVNDVIWVFSEETGAYDKLAHPERAIDAFLPIEQADHLGKRDYEEIVERIRRLDCLQTIPDRFNCDPNLVNCSSGIVDVASLSTIPHSSTLFFTYAVQARFIPRWETREAPVFEQFCSSSLGGDVLKRKLLLEIIGYCCCDSAAGKCALFLKGAPDSGKSVIAEFIRHLFDDTLVSAVPLHKLSDRFNTAELFGKKLNIVGEVKAKKLSDITSFKMVTGGDRMQAEHKGKDPFYYSPKAKLLFSGNALPGTAEADSTAAFTNRLVVLLFNYSVPKEEQDKFLLEKLLSERDEIFTMAMEALHELRARNFIFTLPADSESFLVALKYSGNSVRAFVQDLCIQTPDARIFNRDILAAYESFCRANGLEVRPRHQLYDALDALPGVVPCRLRIGKENCHGRIGLQLRAQGGTMEQNPESTAAQ